MPKIETGQREGLNMIHLSVGLAETAQDIELAKAKIKEILYEPNGFVFSDENDVTEEVIYVVAKEGKIVSYELTPDLKDLIEEGSVRVRTIGMAVVDSIRTYFSLDFLEEIKECCA